MLRWLDNDLRSTRQFWRIVYFHYPPFATGANVNDIQCRWVREAVVPILENYGVQVVFNGHEHSYQRNVPIRRNVQVDQGVGINYFTSGGGGALLYDVPSKPLVAVAKKEFHYLRAEVQGTQITVRSIRQDGAELDNFTITPKPVMMTRCAVTISLTHRWARHHHGTRLGSGKNFFALQRRQPKWPAPLSP
jgi:hypothetical protein